MPDYEEINHIGRGSCGDVFLCRHKETQQEVADKRIYTNFLSEDARAMVLQEAKIMDKFIRSHHPHVVVFREHIQFRGVFHFYMEYCAGGSLEDELTRRKEGQQKYEETEIMSYIYQIAKGLAFIHGKKVIHRNLKPSNILKSGEGILKVADFGLGTALTRTGSERRTKARTLAYKAPEVVQEESGGYSYECDVWSLGVTAYEMLTLRLPFSANNLVTMSRKIIKEPFDPLDNSISHELRTLVTDTMRKDPPERPSSQAISELDVLLTAYKDTQNATGALGRLDIALQRLPNSKATEQELERWIRKWAASDERKTNEYTLLHYVCGKGASAAVIAALCLRDDIEAKCQSDMNRERITNVTPLHVASWSGDIEVVKALLNHKADIEATTSLQRTPLYWASTNGHVEVVNALLDHNADTEARNNLKETPLHVASQLGHIEIVTALLDRNADVEAKDWWRNTSLHFASSKGVVEVVKALLDHKADPEVKDNLGTTPLHCASVVGHVEVVKTLFDHNANIEATDIMNHTPLHVASKNGHIEVVKVLVQRGADVNHCAKCEKYCEKVAAESGQMQT